MAYSQGNLWRDDDGFIAIGTGDDYKTFADLDCSDADIDERESNKDRMILCWNNFDELVDTLKKSLQIIERLSDSYRSVANKHSDFTNGEFRMIQNVINKCSDEKTV